MLHDQVLDTQETLCLPKQTWGEVESAHEAVAVRRSSARHPHPCPSQSPWQKGEDHLATGGSVFISSMRMMRPIDRPVVGCGSFRLRQCRLGFEHDTLRLLPSTTHAGMHAIQLKMQSADLLTIQFYLTHPNRMWRHFLIDLPFM